VVAVDNAGNQSPAVGDEVVEVTQGAETTVGSTDPAFLDSDGDGTPDADDPEPFNPEVGGADDQASDDEGQTAGATDEDGDDDGNGEEDDDSNLLYWVVAVLAAGGLGYYFYSTRET
jgi:hypothetical protein